MSLGKVITAAGLAQMIAGPALTMPETSRVVDDFKSMAIMLPCALDIADLALDLGYVEQSKLQIDNDYSDVTYVQSNGTTELTVASETSPVGTSFLVFLDIPETDQGYADTIVTALRRAWSLPETVTIQDLAHGTAQFWAMNLPQGAAQIVVRHTNMHTQIQGILAPIKPGTPLPC